MQFQLPKARDSIVKATLIAVLLLSPFTLLIHAQEPTQSRQIGLAESINSLPSKAKRWALVIGVDKYVDGQVSPLKGSANDARNLADALARYAGFPADQVILLATDQPEERQPTRVNILRRLSNLAAVVPKDGLLLVSFAGHGMERNGQAYLLPSDAQISDDVTFLEETAVSVQRMKDRIRATGVGQVIVLLDACRNDPGGRADAPNPLTPAYTKFNFDVRNREVQAFATLYATAVGQRAYEYTEKKQGYFTWALVEGLKGGAANERGEVTLAGLVNYIQNVVPKRIGIDMGGGKQQLPFAIIEGYRAEELVIAVAGQAANVPATATPLPPSVDPVAIELSYWETIKNSTNPADFKAYLEKYPDGQFAALAKLRAEPLSEKTAEKTTPVAPPADSASETAFWEAIKESTKAEDFKAYLERYPNGTFAALAKNRINSLELVEGTKWTGKSPGGDKYYEFYFAKGGEFHFLCVPACLLCSNISFKGKWKQEGTTLYMEGSSFLQKYKVKATITNNQIEGSWQGEKYRFIMERATK